MLRALHRLHPQAIPFENLDPARRTLLADVGFGGLTHTAPLFLEPGPAQQTPHEDFRIIEAGGLLRVEAFVASEWHPLYGFDLSEHFEADYEIANYFMSTHPSSPFWSNLILARGLPDRRLVFHNARLSVHLLNGGTQQHGMSSTGDVADALEKRFGIKLADRAGLERAVLASGLLGPPV